MELWCRGEILVQNWDRLQKIVLSWRLGVVNSYLIGSLFLH